jgi:hypothetical protein
MDKEMKPLVFTLLLLFFILGDTVAFAQQKEVKGWLHAKLFLKDGSTVEDYLKNSYSIGGYAVTQYFHEPSALDSVMKLNSMENMFKKNVRYSNLLIDSMYTWTDKMPNIIQVWETQPVNYSFGFEEPIGENYPVMLKRAYVGKHVKGYIIFHPGFGYRLFYKTKDMPCAKAFGKIQKKLTGIRRRTLLEEFSSYPEMEEYIKKMDKKTYTDNPFDILKQLEQILDERGSFPDRFQER